MAGSFFDRSPEQVYFQDLEKLMISLRGAPLQLSPDDWQVSKAWYRDGVPLEVVEESIRDVVERRRDAEKEIPPALRYYRRAVERSWKQLEALTAPGRRAEAPEFGLEKRVANLALALAALPWLAPLRERLLAVDGDVETVEGELAHLDREMLALAFEALEEEERSALDEKVDGTLARFGDQLPAQEKAASRGRLRAEILRRRWSLPVLSLFALEAVAEPSADAAEVGGAGTAEGAAEGATDIAGNEDAP